MSATKEPSEFEKAIDELEQIITDALAENKSCDEWKRSLYQNYTNRFLSDNNRIWVTGGIFIPVALAAFVVPVRVPCAPVLSLIVLGLASVGLIALWIGVAENHRAFQNKSLAWIEALQRSVGIKDPLPAKIAGHRVTKLATVQRMRWTLATAVIIGWIVIVWDRLLATCP